MIRRNDFDTHGAPYVTGCFVMKATINYIVELRCDSLFRNARDNKLTGCTANGIGFALDFRIAKIHWNVLLQKGQDHGAFLLSTILPHTNHNLTCYLLCVVVQMGATRHYSR